MSAISDLLALAALDQTGVEDRIVQAMEVIVPHLSKLCLERLSLIVGGELIDRPAKD
jgi:hypothetical protein